jgi:hypothetical protein
VAPGFFVTERVNRQIREQRLSARELWDTAIHVTGSIGTEQQLRRSDCRDAKVLTHEVRSQPKH